MQKEDHYAIQTGSPYRSGCGVRSYRRGAEGKGWGGKEGGGGRLVTPNGSQRTGEGMLRAQAPLPSAL